MKLQADGNKTTIGGQEYEIQVTLLNHELYIPIPYNKILSLVIEESIYSTFASGRIIIDNAEDIIENYTQAGVNKRGHSLNRSYSYRADGRDIIHISVKPLSPAPDQQEQMFPADLYNLEYAFSVTNEYAHHTELNSAKAKVYELLDLREFQLMEKASVWSTNTTMLEEVDSSVNFSQKSNDDRKVQSGIAIKSFLKSTLGKEQKFTTDWDKGKTKVFYSSPGTTVNMNVLLELLDSHVSESTGDNCLLRLERNGEMSLRSYGDYFKRAITKTGGETNSPGPYILDAFSLPYQAGASEGVDIGQQQSDNNNAFGPDAEFKKLDVDQVSPTTRLSYSLGKNVQWSDFEGIEGYGFSNFSTAGSVTEVTSLPVHNKNIRDKQFNIDNKHNHIENVKTKFQELYCEHFHGQAGKPKAIFPVNDLKTNNHLVTNLMSNNNDRDYRLKLGRNTILSKAVGYAPSISFTVVGLTKRIPGRFISLLGAPSMDTKFQDIIQGEWFITHLTHTFEPGKYTNAVTGVKFYSFK